MAEASLTVATNQWMAKLYEAVGPEASKRITREAGFAGKDAANDAAARKLGSDRAMSNFRRRPALGAGFDRIDATSVRVALRPAGLWVLADQGRKRDGRIYPRINDRKARRPTRGKALTTPWGYRAASSYSRSRGTGVMRMAFARIRDEVPKAAHRQLQVEIGRVIRG